MFDELKNKDTYDFDISVKQRHLTVKINGVKVISMEITDTIFEGKVGLISFNETMTASDFSVEDIAIPKATAHLTNLQVTGILSDGDENIPVSMQHRIVIEINWRKSN